MENRPLIKFRRNYIRDSSGVFSISSHIDDVISHFYTQLFVQKHSCLYNKKKISQRVRIRILFSRGKKQYFTHSLRSFVKYCFYHSKIKFISSRRRVISSIYIKHLFLFFSIANLVSTVFVNRVHTCLIEHQELLFLCQGGCDLFFKVI